MKKLKTENDYVQKAFEIKKALNDFFKTSTGKNLKIPDINPYLIRHGLFIKDENNGLFFRQFLKELKNKGLLKIIPHINYEETNNRINWYFNPIEISKEKKQFIPKQKIKSQNYNNITTTLSKKQFNLLTKLEIEKTEKFIKNLPKNESRIPTNNYERSFALWTNNEIRLLLRFLEKTNDINFIASLLKRSTNSVKIKYEELKFEPEE